MPISWSQIKENWIKNFEIGYSRHSIETAFNTIIDLWGPEFLDKHEKRTSWGIVGLIDTGLLLHELNKIEDSGDLIARLKRGEGAAYSEGRIATHFSRQGYKVVLQPIAEGISSKNDVAVKVNSKWVNIEVKTPTKSELEKEMGETVDNFFKQITKNTLYRDVDVFLFKEPDYKKNTTISNVIRKLSRPNAPATSKQINEIAFIRTNIPPPRTVYFGPMKLVPSYPESVRHHYDDIPVLFFSRLQFYVEKNRQIIINITVNFPFEDSRIIERIQRKRRQLSPNSMNMVALDTTFVPIKRYRRWIRRLNEAFNKKLSRRIGAVLFFSRSIDNGRLNLKSSLFINPDPYIPLPSIFLEKCDLNSYADIRDLE